MLAAANTDEAESVVSSAKSPRLTTHLGLLFGGPTRVERLASLLPDKHMLSIYWRLFVQNVDLLVRIFHKPTIETLIRRAGDDPTSISLGEEALLFSICFAVITSMSENETTIIMAEERSILIWRYESALHQALSRAGLLDTQELVVLQAFVLMLICCQSLEDSQTLWTMIGVAIRIAEAMGLHRDGEIFGLTPMETELRRRLWWQIYLLDQRTAERQGFSSKITEHLFDTELPLNINDTDISAEDSVLPTPRSDCTEMAFSLIRYKFTSALCFLRKPDPLPGKRLGNRGTRTFAERKKVVEACEKRIEDENFKNCSHDSVICHFTKTIGKVVIAQMWLELYHPLHNSGGDVTLTKEISDRLFISSIDMIDHCWNFTKSPGTRNWAWYARVHVQWHAVAYLLAELCHRDATPLTTRAWKVIDEIFTSFGEALDEKNNLLRWKPLKLLRQKALKRCQNSLNRSSSSATDVDSQLNTSNSFTQGQVQHVEDSQFPMGYYSKDISEDSWLTSTGTNRSTQLAPNFHRSIALPISPAPTDYQQTASDAVLMYDPSCHAPSELIYPPLNTTKGCQHLTALEWENLIKEMEIDSDPWPPKSRNLGMDLWF
jgi:hypothetical protein